MSPEMLELHNGNQSIGSFNPEKADIFSLGLSFIRVIN